MSSILKESLEMLVFGFMSDDRENINEAKRFYDGLVLGCRLNNDKATLLVLMGFIRAFPQHFKEHCIEHLIEYIVEIERKVGS